MHYIFSLLFIVASYANNLNAEELIPVSPIAITIIGDQSYAPYSYMDNGVAKGLYVDILEKAFAKINNYQVELQMVPWKRGLAMIKEGTKFAIFPPYFWPDKRQFISRYSKAIYQEKVVAICNRFTVPAKQRQWPRDYLGMKIGTNRGFLSPGPEFFKLVEREKINLIYTKNSNTALRMLMLKRIDCYVNSKLAIQWHLKEFNHSSIYKNLTGNLYYSASISENNAHIGYSKEHLALNPNHQNFIDQLDIILLNMRHTGELESILSQFLTPP